MGAAKCRKEGTGTAPWWQAKVLKPPSYMDMYRLISSSDIKIREKSQLAALGVNFMTDSNKVTFIIHDG